MSPVIRYVIEVIGITDFDARASYKPWTNKPARVVLGFEVHHADAADIEYIYLMPVMDGVGPAVGVFRGIYGDPALDQQVHTIGGGHD